jgi:hypothetical protein
MKMKKSILVALTAVVVMLSMAESAWALSLNPFKRAGRSQAHTLMVTGNYLESRLLVELAQYRTKQPILLFSPDVDGSQQLFYLQAGGKATSMDSEKYLEFIEFINPKRIVFLGGDDFVPPAFVDMARSRYSVMMLDSKDWLKNAAMLGDWLKHQQLVKQYEEFRGRLTESGVRPKD